MIQAIKDWYNLYGSLENFLTHKLTHVGVGFLICFLCALGGHIAAGLVVTTAIAVLKELADYIELDGVDDTVNKIIYHTFDVIVTVLGGLAGIGLVALL